MFDPNETVVWIWKQHSGVQDPGERGKILNSCLRRVCPLGLQSDID